MKRLLLAAATTAGLLFTTPWVYAEPHLAQTMQSANQGDADAQFNLGLMYAFGRGVRQDYAQARQ